MPTLKPNPSIGSALSIGLTIAALSAPRTQCGTITVGVDTFTSPSRFISAEAQLIALSSPGDPLTRLPIRSHK